MEPPLLSEALPAFYRELLDAAESEALPNVLAQLPQLRLDSRCGCGEPGCATVYVTSALSPLSEAEQADRGPFLRDTLLLDTPEGHVALDLDHLDKVQTIEILNRPDVRRQLDQLAWLTPKHEPDSYELR